MFYLGTITGTSGAASNAWTGPSGAAIFSVPPGAKSLYLVSSASGVLFELGVATGISFQTSQARGAQIAGPGVLNGPYRCGGQTPQGFPTVVSIYNPGLGTVSVRVYASPTS